MIQIKFKRCSKCKQVCPTTNFGKDRKAKDGLQFWCKDCKQKYRQEHKKEAKIYGKKYIQEHKEETQKYTQEHKEETQKYRQEHKEEIAKNKKKYRQEHKEERLRWRKKYNQSENGKKVMRAYPQSNNGKMVALKKHAKRKRQLGFIPFNVFGNAFTDMDNDFHHCNNLIVVEIPRAIHKNNLGTNHRKQIADYFSEYMGIDTFQELSGVR